MVVWDRLYGDIFRKSMEAQVLIVHLHVANHNYIDISFLIYLNSNGTRLIRLVNLPKKK